MTGAGDGGLGAGRGTGDKADGPEFWDDYPSDRVAEAGAVRSYEDLRVWQAALALATAIYVATRGFPDDERLGLTAQMRRASVSVASNIAEGYGRGSRADYLRFLAMARGSLYEVETQLRIASNVGFPEPEEAAPVQSALASTGRQLNALIRSLRT